MGDPFPLRAAALDVGSNAIRFTAAEFTDVTNRVELESQRFAVRLGHDTFRTGVLSRQTLDAAVASAVHCRRRLDDLGISHYRAVATSAVRESRNGGELVELIRRESGLHLETITGSEEARLVWVAVRRQIDFAGGPWLLADLGGGSIELSIIDEAGIRWSESHPMGTVRLLEDLGQPVPDSAEFRHLVERYAARLSLPPEAQTGLQGVIITGGNAETLADLTAPGADPRGVLEIDRKGLRRTLDRLAPLTIAERIERFGLREDRADVIVPAAIIYDRVAEIARTERLLVPRVGVKDGLLEDLVADFAEHARHESELDRMTASAAVALGRRYRFDEPHARQVKELSLSLFDQLEALHRLDESSRRKLGAAALLHDIGQFVSYRRHHKHSWYLLANSELPGLSPEEMREVALIARYHRRSEPKEEHEGYRDLSDRARTEVRKLAAILRVADALDREHQGHVRRLTAIRRGSRISLTLETADDTALEEWALATKAALFERVYEVELEVV